jgi:hypothetical protein
MSPMGSLSLPKESSFNGNITRSQVISEFHFLYTGLVSGLYTEVRSRAQGDISLLHKLLISTVLTLSLYKTHCLNI